MSIKACAECGKDVSGAAKSCPHCGRNMEGVISKLNRVGGNVATIFMFLGVIAVFIFLLS